MEHSLPGIKIVGKIQLSEADLNKKRYKKGQSQYRHLANAADIDSGIVPEDVVDQIYDELAKLENSKRSNEQIMHLRVLLEFAFALRLHPSIRFEERVSYTSLHENIEAYYKLYPKELSAKSIVTDVRLRLNNIVHNSIFREITDRELRDLHHKVRTILDGLFYRDTVSKMKAEEPSIFDVNNEQLDAVESSSNVILVNAGPGTGKTHLIVDRMIKSAEKSGNKTVVALAYTNEAAKQLRERYIYTIFGTEDYGNVDNIQICTIHSFAFNTLKAYSEKLSGTFDYEVIDESDESEICQEFNGNAVLVSEYMKDNRLLTFNGILAMFYETLTNNSEMQEYVVDNISEIILDEAQDASVMAAKVLKKIYDMASGQIKIFLVGDQRQNIFAFNSGSLLNFKKVGFIPREYNLHRCYRCPKSILGYVNSFHFSDCRNEPLYNSNIDPSDKLPECVEFMNEDDEAAGIVSKIISLKKSLEIDYKDIAVLMNNSNLFPTYGRVCNEKGIPFVYHGGKSDLLPSIKRLLHYLGALESNKHSLKKFLSFLDVSFAPNMSFNSEDQVLEYALTKSSHAKRFVPLVKKYRAILQSGTIDYTMSDAIDEYANLTEDASIIKDFSLAVKSLSINSYKDLKLKIGPGVKSFEKFYYRPKDVKSKIESDDCINISTIHSAKGGEWKYVFVIGMTDGKMPAYLRSNEVKDYIAHENNELKKFYVACTRAIGQLYLSWTKSYTVGKYTFNNRRMSKFLSLHMDVLNIGSPGHFCNEMN